MVMYRPLSRGTPLPLAAAPFPFVCTIFIDNCRADKTPRVFCHTILQELFACGLFKLSMVFHVFVIVHYSITLSSFGHLCCCLEWLTLSKQRIHPSLPTCLSLSIQLGCSLKMAFVPYAYIPIQDVPFVWFGRIRIRSCQPPHRKRKEKREQRKEKREKRKHLPHRRLSERPVRAERARLAQIGLI